MICFLNENNEGVAVSKANPLPVKIIGGCGCVNSPTLKGTIPEVTLEDNTEEVLTIDIEGLLKDEHYKETILTDISGLDISINFYPLGIDGKIKVIIKNNSGATQEVPSINFSLKQIQ